MKTIEERAKERFPIDYKKDNSEICFNQGNRQFGYIEGVTKQREIDIELASEWIEQNIERFVDTLYGVNMEDCIFYFKEAMKGEKL